MDRLRMAGRAPAGRASHAALLGLSLVLMAGVPARAAETLQCPQWRVPASFTIIQTNGPHVTFELNQNGSTLSGRAHYGSVSGRVEGSIVGTAFSARALWTDSGLKSVGNYAGQISPRTLYGQIGPTTVADINDGVTYDEYISPHKPAGFVMRDLSCSYPAPGKALGRVKLPGPVGFGRVGAPSTERPPICDAARSARARNSPTAAALEQRCLASGGSLVPPVDAPPPPSPPIPETNTPTTMPTTVPAVDSTRIDGLAATGANIANQDTDLAYVRAAESGAEFQRGFDIATGLFGDPSLGAEGRAAADPQAASIRESLDSDGQRGFDASADYQFGTQGAR